MRRNGCLHAARGVSTKVGNKAISVVRATNFTHAETARAVDMARFSNDVVRVEAIGDVAEMRSSFARSRVASVAAHKGDTVKKKRAMRTALELIPSSPSIQCCIDEDRASDISILIRCARAEPTVPNRINLNDVGLKLLLNDLATSSRIYELGNVDLVPGSVGHGDKWQEERMIERSIERWSANSPVDGRD